VILSDLSDDEIQQALAGDGLNLEIGPFTTCVKSKIPAVIDNIRHLYRYNSLSNTNFADFHIELIASTGLRRFYKPKVNFFFDGRLPFKPLPYAQSFAFFEWGLNWCVANHAHQYAIVHAAVIEKNGFVAIMPGSPGAGKSTLCAALVNRGWRLFSDEMALINPETLHVIPIPRPISLKNESINIIKSFAPDVEFGLLAEDTHKGAITHIMPPKFSIELAGTSAPVKWVIFPKYKSAVPLELNEMKKAEAAMQFAEQGFNYNVLGEQGFDVMVSLIDQASVYRLEYSSLDDAVAKFAELSNE